MHSRNIFWVKNGKRADTSKNKVLCNLVCSLQMGSSGSYQRYIGLASIGMPHMFHGLSCQTHLLQKLRDVAILTIPDNS